MTNSISSCYENLVEQNLISGDKEQTLVVKKLDTLKIKLEKQHKKSKKPFLSGLLSRKNYVKGIYIYGDVGRGKSMLMDLFFDNITITKKRRVHFHAFMLEVHSHLYKWRHENKNNPKALYPMPSLAKEIAEKTSLLCFDELQVNDITDAMILGRLFHYLFEEGITVIATSNRHPDDLYKDGLQRENFLPFIDILKEKVEILELNAKKDYRLDHLKSLTTVYYTPLGKKADKFLKDTFKELTNDADPTATEIRINSRTLKIQKSHGDVAWVSFSELCETPLGSGDYIQLAKEFSTIILSDIPKLTRENRNEAKRFVTLIDELYEHKVKLVCSAECTPENIYEEGDESFEFKRTISRLHEMQSEQYIKQEHFT